MSDADQIIGLTKTEQEQWHCEATCREYLASYIEVGLFNEDGEVRLLRERHEAYVLRGLRHLPAGFLCLDASRPWLCYWILHAQDLLVGDARQDTEQELMGNVIATMSSCQNAVGGFGGGPQQISHCAPTYAAVLALLIVGTKAAYDVIDRSALYRWFLSRKHAAGGFCLHEDGEVDVRGTYTVISVASILNILTAELIDGAAEYLLSCQTYEGGFGGQPGSEAHGGYVFCSLAALIILGRARDADLKALEVSNMPVRDAAMYEAWLVNRQMGLEGGFQGRTNKLVDGCYTFWQGAAVTLLNLVKLGEERQAVGWTTSDGSAQLFPSNAQFEDGQEIAADDAAGVTYGPVSVMPSDPSSGNMSINQHALQCAQSVEGGLRDKPGKPKDFYHTCYCLSGLSCAQWGTHIEEELGISTSAADGGQQNSDSYPVVFGDVGNLVAATNPLYNVRPEKVEQAMRHFWSELPTLSHQEMLNGYKSPA